MTQPLNIEDILGKAKPPERSVPLCLAGDLAGQYDELEHQLRDASTVALSLGEPAEATKIARQMAALREQMVAAQVVFRLRALGDKPWRALRDAAPDEAKTEEEQATYDDRYHDWVCKLVAATVYDPVMNPEQADLLASAVGGGQWKQLADTAWELNAARRDIPFSAAASALIQYSDLKSKPPGPGASRTAGGSARKPSRSRNTSTTAKAG